jgi:DNA-binding CsgD family transcriptional regulator
MSLENVGRPQLLERAAVKFCDDVKRLPEPSRVIAALHRTGIPFGVNLWGVWRRTDHYTDFNNYVLGENVWFHERVPDRFWRDYRDGLRRHGASALAMHARTRNGPFLLSEAMQVLNLSGEDRWLFDLYQTYNVRDGLYCPLKKWSALWTTSRVPLKLRNGERYLLVMVTAAAIESLDQFVLQRMRKSHGGRLELTERETAILRGLSIGHSTKTIAQRLDIGYETVRSHLKHAMHKLGTRDRTHAVAEAMRRRLLK